MAMDSEGLKLQLAKLSSTNYRSWSTIIKLVLASNDLVGYIESSFNDLIDAKT
jgi:gag-polypeptide of LTR copia-type